MTFKGFILKTVYPLLERLPPAWTSKAKIIGNVLMNDWQMGPITFFDIRRTMPETEAKSFFDTTDEETMMLLHRQYVLGEMAVDGAHTRRFFFNHTGLLCPHSRETIKMIRKARRLFTRKTGLNDFGPETFYYKHGLVFLEQKQREYIKERAFIDAGAYLGESILALLEGQPSHIYSFEPCPRNYRQILNTIARNKLDASKITVVQKGLGEHEQTLHVKDTEGCNANISLKGDVAWEITTIDNFDRQHPMKLGFIKADVEGEALNLLKGALNVIRRDRPILSIAVYHTADEFLGIPKLLSSLNYKVRLRCLNPLSVLGEITVLATPND